MTSLNDLFQEWNEFNIKAGESMGQFDFSKIKEIRKGQSNVENSIYEVLKKHASDDLLKILPEECGELEMGYNTKDKIFYFVMLDPEFEDSEEVKLLAVTIDLNNSVNVIKDFKIED
ncbi:unnamed protein product [marine sediment metagenome]|uniref:Uncharacterized protein n=1 Tax=marine sediment metagenome TaxID=412755 RepID=X1GXN3_9ZZZZ